MPFSGYENFDDCISKNRDKQNPEAYCSKIHKETTGKYPNQKTFTFSTDSIQFKEIDGKEYVIGYASTGDKDLVGDIVTQECLQGMAEQIKKRNIKIDLEHETWDGQTNWDKEKAKTKLPAAKIVSATIDSKGLLIKAELNPDYKRFDEKGNVTFDYTTLKNNLKNKFLDAFSIAYIPLETAIQETKEGTIRLLKELNLLNVAFTGNPANPKADFRAVLTKSLDYLEKEAKNMDVEEKMKALQKEVKSNSEKLEEEIKSLNEQLEELKTKETENEEEDETPEEEAEVKENKEVEELKEALAKTNEELAEIKSILKKPQRKSVQEDMNPKLEEEQKSNETKTNGPLDAVI